MILLDIDNEITSLITVFALRVEIVQRQNRHDINIVAENVIKSLLGKVYGWTELNNLNTESANFPGIDLADDEARIAIQVTSDNSSAKITHTLEQFVKPAKDDESPTFERYDRLIIYILTNKKDRYAGNRWDQITSGKLRFDKARDIWDHKKLLGDILDLDVSKKSEILEYLQSVIGSFPKIETQDSTSVQATSADLSRSAMDNWEEGAEVERLDEQSGTSFLLRRAQILDVRQPLEAVDAIQLRDARAICRYLGGLTLALEQAGAYMYQQDVTPGQYLDLLRQHRLKLNNIYPDSQSEAVAVTVSIAIQQMKKAKYGKAAVELCKISALLASAPIPDGIFFPEGSLLPGAPADRSTFKDFGHALGVAGRYGLIFLKLDMDNLRKVLAGEEPSLYWMPELVQNVLRIQLTRDEEKANVQVIVDVVSVATRQLNYSQSLSMRLLPHALLCGTYIVRNRLYTLESANLLSNTAWYLKSCQRYEEAEGLYNDALDIYGMVLGSELELVPHMERLAQLYCEMGRYTRAARVLEEILAIDLELSGDDIKITARLRWLGEVYFEQHLFDKAEKATLSAIEIARRNYGADHPELVELYSNLHAIYAAVRKYAEASVYLKMAKTIVSEAFDEDDPRYAWLLMLEAKYNLSLGSHESVEPLLELAALKVNHALSPNDTDVAYFHDATGLVRESMGDSWVAANDDPAALSSFDVATKDFRTALPIFVRTFGQNSYQVRKTQESLGRVEEKANRATGRLRRHQDL